ncbi:hypothetical protein OTU49_010420 [Cherax quadricarinatus]|uniref:RING-type E3 ubiquitin transferase n=1 Tax=Cherax quadricarinatus TaxID=27406 RepID=A0AAW0WEL6_CHEQU|nr:uncharacterized protein LOC128702369 [Cherax quadricarinatus]XP_053652579.1 uncharacterized protein LOC128702369 [Cherax quadricarinatus]XP_053652580.1 uncharacterized protein LOC128702369 [Cherax quadricarinatus]
MPGPVLKLSSPVSDSSHDLAMFESCEDMSQAWGGLNGNLSQESLYHDCNKQHHIDYQREYVNWTDFRYSDTNTTEMPTKEIYKMATTSAKNKMIKTEKQVREIGLTHTKESFEDMEVENSEAAETINVPVVEACLSVDINTSLTRKKIASVQMGRTLSYVDKDDPEESPTRRLQAVHTNESVDIATAPKRPSDHSENQENPKMLSSGYQSNRVYRNPSYHFAVKDTTILSPRHVVKTESFDQDTSIFEDCLPCDEHHVHSATEEKKVSESCKRHLSTGDEITLPLAPNMPRSVSFSGPEILSPPFPAGGSLSEGHSRSGSASQLSAPTSKCSSPPSEKSSPRIVRGSAITRSFRRLFSSPARNTPSSPPEEFWPDIPDSQPSPTSEPRTPSRLRKLSNTISRHLTPRSKMSDKTTFAGTNGHQMLSVNGAPVHADTQNLVEYENLLKLFCCSGCQVFMAPPLHQCRKGHLVCGTCRLTLKQTCPVCKQRFADNTNMMMEQVCQLVKFPCRWASDGCPEYHPPKAKLDHEHFCVYRPVQCHHGPKGCPRVVLLRDMGQHLETCAYKDK